jgi:hypothetical protein
MRPMAKETHIKTDKKTRWRLGCLGVTYKQRQKRLNEWKVHSIKERYCVGIGNFVRE